MMFKRFLIIAVAALALAGCKGHRVEPSKAIDVTGEWELTSITTRGASIGGTPIAVYISFTAESGTYESGKPWGSVYTVAMEGDQMTLTTNGGSETDTYRKTTIPQAVKDNIY